MANRVLDGFILKEIDFTVCEEIIVTQDALEFESFLIEKVLRFEIEKIGRESIR